MPPENPNSPSELTIGQVRHWHRFTAEFAKCCDRPLISVEIRPTINQGQPERTFQMVCHTCMARGPEWSENVRLSDFIEDWKRQVAYIRERGELHEDKEDLQVRSLVLQEERDRLQKEKEELQARNLGLYKEKEELMAQKEEREKETSGLVQDMKKEFCAVRAHLEAEVARLQNKVDGLEDEISEFQDRNNDLQDKNSKLELKLHEARSQAASAELRLKEKTVEFQVSTSEERQESGEMSSGGVWESGEMNSSGGAGGEAGKVPVRESGGSQQVTEDGEPNAHGEGFMSDHEGFSVGPVPSFPEPEEPHSERTPPPQTPYTNQAYAPLLPEGHAVEAPSMPSYPRTGDLRLLMAFRHSRGVFAEGVSVPLREPDEVDLVLSTLGIVLTYLCKVGVLDRSVELEHTLQVFGGHNAEDGSWDAWECPVSGKTGSASAYIMRKKVTAWTRDARG